MLSNKSVTLLLALGTFALVGEGACGGGSSGGDGETTGSATGTTTGTTTTGTTTATATTGTTTATTTTGTTTATTTTTGTTTGTTTTGTTTATVTTTGTATTGTTTGTTTTGTTSPDVEAGSDASVGMDATLGSDASPAKDGGSGSDAASATDAKPPADSSAVDTGAVTTDAGMQPYKGVANSPCNDLITLGATWYYNWEISPSPSCPSTPFVPMVWGHSNELTQASITTEVAGVVAKGYKYVLGFNEPDNSNGQANIAEPTAIALWPAFNNSAVLIGSPATQANTTGQTWFKSFMSAVNADTTGTLRVDFIAAHWYGWNTGSCDAKAANLESYINYLEGIPGNRPIWLTEWGCLNDSNPDAATVQAFFTGAVTMFTKHPRLVRYAWYPWTTYNELDVADAAPDTLTSLGAAFAAEPQYK